MRVRLSPAALEYHDVVHAIDELRPEQTLELAHRPALDLVGGETGLARGAKAHARVLRDLACADVARHDDDRIAEVHRLALLSVRRPSSSTCSSMLKMSGCAFSISSNRTTEYGLRRTALVSWPPSSWPT